MEANLVEYFASPLTEADLKRFDLKLGDPAGQQVWESLGALAALRLWAPRWQNRRVRLTVKGDSIAMLTTVLHLKAGSLEELPWIRLNSPLNPTSGFISQALLMILPTLSAARRHPRRPCGVCHHRCVTQRKSLRHFGTTCFIAHSKCRPSHRTCFSHL